MAATGFSKFCLTAKTCEGLGERTGSSAGTLEQGCLESIVDVAAPLAGRRRVDSRM